MVPSRCFYYDAATKTFIADASDLPDNVFERIWQDSCDYGVRMYSVKTGAESAWYVDETVKDPEDGVSVVMWKLKPTPETVRAERGLEDVLMEILND